MIEMIEGIKEENIGTDVQVAVEKTALARDTDDLQVAQNEEDTEDDEKNVKEKNEEDVIGVIQQVQVGAKAKAKPEAKRKKKEESQRIRTKTERNLGKYQMKKW
jgi:hypothetical protein